MTTSGTNELTFVTVNRPEDIKKPTNKYLVRSSAARHHRPLAASDAALQRGKRRIDQLRYRSIEAPTAQQVAHIWRPDETVLEEAQRASLQAQIVGPLGAGRVDPFQTYPVQWQPHVPALVDHYLNFMGAKLPMLANKKTGNTLKTRWFPFVMTHESVFRVILLIAATHDHSARPFPSSKVHLLELKEKAIQSINALVPAPATQPSDWLIAAVAKMACYEAMFGDKDTYCIHMQGLQQLILARGGLQHIGSDKLLERIIVGIDFLAGLHFRIPPFFPAALQPTMFQMLTRGTGNH